MMDKNRDTQDSIAELNQKIDDLKSEIDYIRSIMNQENSQKPYIITVAQNSTDSLTELAKPVSKRISDMGLPSISKIFGGTLASEIETKDIKK
jgi:hypothetical protein